MEDTIRSNRFRRLTVCSIALLVLHMTGNAQLVINEVSQGASGSKEYVELVVTGTPSCSGIPTVDLRGWYIDDNNGNHATGAGTGIAPGCIRFTTDPLWSAVPIGTIIVVYNDVDLNPLVPMQDLSLTDGNCRLVIPAGDCALIEDHATEPSNTISTYPTTGFTSCGVWTTTSMANSDDSYQTIDPSGNMVHSVSWGNNTLNTIIYFTGASGGMVIWNDNTINTSPALQGNWLRTAIAGNETPGLPNSAANAAWIASMNNNCSVFIPLSATSSSVATCSCTGSATANPSGGIGPYTYSWAPSGGTGSTATSLCPGSYTCTITDITGCTATVVATVGALSSPVATVQSFSNATCNGGSDGAAAISASGGTGVYTYNWLPSGGTSSTATGLSAGNYTCTITDSNGCTATQTVSITQPLALTTIGSQTNVLCNGGNNGSASIAASGGTGIYTYNWMPSGGTTTNETGLQGGTYTCVVTDGNGCSVSALFAITEPSALGVSATSSPAGCLASDGSASVSVSGGTPGYSYNWVPSGGNGATELNLAAGSYTCNISDANGCTITTSVTVGTTGNAPVATITANGPTTICQNDSVILTASGASQFLWSTGDTTFSIVATTAGTFFVVVTNACGSDTASIAVAVNPLPVVTLSASGPTTFCSGDSVLLNASGAQSYVWSSGDSTASINVNASGTFIVTGSDACGSDTASITIIVLQPPVVSLSASGPITFCQGDSVTLTASGASSYQWSTGDTSTSIVAYTSGTYLVSASNVCGADTAQITTTITPLPVAVISGDTVICPGQTVTLTAGGGGSFIWSTGATTGSIGVNSSGIYFVIVANACGSDTAQIIIQPSVVNAAFTATPDSGQVPLTVSFTDASTNAVSWNWSLGPNGTSGATDPTTTFTIPGTHTIVLTVTNSDGCSDTTSMVIIVDDVPPVLEVPNVFTPNGDGTNDLFFPYTEGIEEVMLDIYDRWGVLIFSVNGNTVGWDGHTKSGTAATDGTYYYVIHAVAYNGTTFERTGFFLLIR